jgi:small-conductance mechanosensitive channel
MKRHTIRTAIFVGLFLLVAAAGLVVTRLVPDLQRLPSGLAWPDLVALLAGVLAVCGIFSLATHLFLAHKGRPPVEGVMVGRLYWLLGLLAVLFSLAYGLNVLATFGTLFSLFGGMLLGWSLQAPVSGFAAWILVSLKRPFRPGDRVQFPNLNLTGDVKDIGPMYTVLDQVGGSIGTEEAVGRDIMVPNAMLFNQVVINYTVSQKGAYMLDEVVLRITYDSDWQKAEQILIRAANEVTHDIIAAAGEQPYIRADFYDYGVYLRLRYLTRVKDRVEVSYLINKAVFEEIQKTTSVDLAIPFIYSFRAAQGVAQGVAQDLKAEEFVARAEEAGRIVDIDIARIAAGPAHFDPQDLEQLACSIKSNGLLQPVILVPKVGTADYEILAGSLRFEACKKLGWKTIPALVRGPAPVPSPSPVPSATQYSPLCAAAGRDKDRDKVPPR